MDKDTAALIQSLCVRAGMIMEDASVEAVTWQIGYKVEDAAKLLRLTTAAEVISRLLAAAAALGEVR